MIMNGSESCEFIIYPVTCPRTKDGRVIRGFSETSQFENVKWSQYPINVMEMKNYPFVIIYY